MVSDEDTLVLIKPDAFYYSLTADVRMRFSEWHTGLRVIGAKIVRVTKELAEEHYAEHRSNPVFPHIVDYLMGKLHYADPSEENKRRVEALVYHGMDAVKVMRDILGPANPNEAKKVARNSLRAMGSVVPIGGKYERFDNLAHGSASVADAEREIKLWFKPNDIAFSPAIYPTARATEHFYYKDGKVLAEDVPGSLCLVAPEDTVWLSDLNGMVAYRDGKACSQPLAAIVAKYKMNEAAFQ